MGGPIEPGKALAGPRHPGQQQGPLQIRPMVPPAWAHQLLHRHEALLPSPPPQPLPQRRPGQGLHRKELARHRQQGRAAPTLQPLHPPAPAAIG